jgi:hypothetical protein
MTWSRLEGTSVDAALTEGAEARIADPLWSIGRQWQVGELTGDDAASPVLVECEIRFTPITRFQPGPPGGGGPAVPRGMLGVPIETAVEREGVRDGPASARLSAEAGLQLLRTLDRAGAPPAARTELRARFPIALPPDDGLDPHGREELELLAAGSFDAAALAADLDAGAPTGIDALERGRPRAVLQTWLAWYAGQFSEPADGSGSWEPRRMEYRFAMSACPAAGQEVVLEAGEYPGGRLEWDAFDVGGGRPPLGAPPEAHTRSLRTLASPARVAGQAASRWWQVEDGDVWLGDLSTGALDLTRAALAAFEMSFADDWFVIPCRLPAGIIARVERLEVRDTFGDRHRIRSCAELDGPGRVWRFFELSGDRSADAAKTDDREAPWLLLPPTLAGVVESRPVEEVLFLRDELANLGWAAELSVESAAGRPIDREAIARAQREPPPVPAADAWGYRLATTVLSNQVPLVPVRRDGELFLQRGRLATAADGGDVETSGALGIVLEPGRALLIEDGEVPATGMRVTRTWQMARAADGGVVCWMGRRKTSAPPRGAPGLVFDEVVSD